MTRLGITCYALAATLLASNAWSQSAGTVDFWNGTVGISAKAGKQIPYNGLGLNPGDTIETGSDGELHIVLADGGFLAVRPNSVVRLAAFSAKGDDGDETWIDLVHGALRSVHEGATILRTPKGELELRAGDAASVRDAADTPRLHDGVPQFMHERQGKFEQRIAEYAERIDQQIGRVLRERGLLKEGEPVERYYERRRQDIERDSARPQATERRGADAKPERTERASDRPERTERATDRPERTERANERPDRGEKQSRPERSERNRGN
jgi:hypothetical protein